MGIRPERGAATLSPARRCTRDRAKPALARPLRALALAALVLSLGGCAGDSPFAALGPRVPDVPKVDPANYLSVGAPDVKRRPILSAPDQAKLQQNLENLSKDNGKALEAKIEQGT